MPALSPLTGGCHPSMPLKQLQVHVLATVQTVTDLKDSPLVGLVQTALWLETIRNFLVIGNPLGYWLGRSHVHRIDFLKAGDSQFSITCW